jgi:hypothetical protein
MSLSLHSSQWETQIHQASPGEFWFFVIVAGTLALAAFYYAFVYYKRALAIDDTPTSRIRSAAQGYVELQGRGEQMDGPPIVAPFSGVSCTWYRYKVEKISDKRSHVLESGTSDELFVLVGETGRCVIDPEHAHVIPTVKKIWYAASHPPSQFSQRGGFLNRVGARYRYSEERMHPGDPLYAIGWFKSVGGYAEAFNTREELRALLAEWKANPRFLLEKFDRNKDGEIDQQEWEVVRKAAAQVVKKQQSRRVEQPPTHIMAKPADSHYPYVLSSLPQQQLTRRLRIYAAALFAGFLLAGAFAVWMINVRL